MTTLKWMALLLVLLLVPIACVGDGDSSVRQRGSSLSAAPGERIGPETTDFLARDFAQGHTGDPFVSYAPLRPLPFFVTVASAVRGLTVSVSESSSPRVRRVRPA